MGCTRSKCGATAVILKSTSGIREDFERLGKVLEVCFAAASFIWMYFERPLEVCGPNFCHRCSRFNIENRVVRHHSAYVKQALDTTRLSRLGLGFCNGS
jgi:hypothetical protein